jgi:hypothetical protein
VSNSGTFFSNCLTIAVATSVSAIRGRIIERVVFTEYQLDCLDLYLVELGPRIVNRRNRTLIPIVRERDATATPPNLLGEQFRK